MSIFSNLRASGFLKTTRMVVVMQEVFRGGFRGALKRYGWKILAGVFFAYLIRDLVLYVLIPLWVAKAAGLTWFH